ncbi:uncharacterized protein LOC131878664 [Tigriopus californicus]|uniref:uncharacterized protein LOC131878664 n=1 Tax=Tigriopus californicus TaxID=6832 RepID=UPI0027DAA4A3|nr:uncharacterized protein LOC131878664 [Tigriopus californicus]
MEQTRNGIAYLLDGAANIGNRIADGIADGAASIGNRIADGFRALSEVCASTAARCRVDQGQDKALDAAGAAENPSNAPLQQTQPPSYLSDIVMRANGDSEETLLSDVRRLLELQGLGIGYTDHEILTSIRSLCVGGDRRAEESSETSSSTRTTMSSGVVPCFRNPHH